MKQQKAQKRKVHVDPSILALCKERATRTVNGLACLCYADKICTPHKWQKDSQDLIEFVERNTELVYPKD